jgi:hypothetical protein
MPKEDFAMAVELNPIPDGCVLAYAVVQTGCILPNSDIVVFKSEEGLRIPAVLFIHPDYDKCRRMSKRLATRISRIEGFQEKGSETSTPILGVKVVYLPAPKPRKQTEAHANGAVGSADGKDAKGTGGKGRRPVAK